MHTHASVNKIQLTATQNGSSTGDRGNIMNRREGGGGGGEREREKRRGRGERMRIT